MHVLASDVGVKNLSVVALSIGESKASEGDRIIVGLGVSPFIRGGDDNRRDQSV